MLAINSISLYAKEKTPQFYIKNNSCYYLLKVWEQPKKELDQCILQKHLEVDSECVILSLILMTFLRGNFCILMHSCKHCFQFLGSTLCKQL